MYNLNGIISAAVITAALGMILFALGGAMNDYWTILASLITTCMSLGASAVVVAVLIIDPTA